MIIHIPYGSPKLWCSPNLRYQDKYLGKFHIFWEGRQKIWPSWFDIYFQPGNFVKFWLCPFQNTYMNFTDKWSAIWLMCRRLFFRKSLMTFFEEKWNYHSIFLWCRDLGPEPFISTYYKKIFGFFWFTLWCNKLIIVRNTPSPWLTRIRFTRISLTCIFKKFPFLT